MDVVIPLVFGVLLAVRPQAFLKQGLSAEVHARRRTLLRRIGFVLIGVAVLYTVIAAVEGRP